MARGPIGGFKVIYEHANQLAARGHAVTVLHPVALDPPKSLRGRLRRWREGHALRETASFRPDAWCKVDPRVHLAVVPSLEPQHAADADVVVATAWQTAEWVRTYPPTKGKQFYFLQDYEYYMTAAADTRQRMVETFQSGMTTLTPFPIMRRILREHGVDHTARIPLGIDFDLFYREVPIDSPNREGVVGFPDRAEPFKGTRDAIAALEIVRMAHARPLCVYAFGPRPATVLPDWIRFYRMPSNADLRRLYNGTSVFVLPSHFEGFGLPGAEALACGAALASTDSGGVRDYAFHEQTALLSPPNEPEALAANVLRLLASDDLRHSLASQGERAVRTFTWHAAGEAFAQLLDA